MFIICGGHLMFLPHHNFFNTRTERMKKRPNLWRYYFSFIFSKTNEWKIKTKIPMEANTNNTYFCANIDQPKKPEKMRKMVWFFIQIFVFIPCEQNSEKKNPYHYRLYTHRRWSMATADWWTRQLVTPCGALASQILSIITTTSYFAVAMQVNWDKKKD